MNPNTNSDSEAQDIYSQVQNALATSHQLHQHNQAVINRQQRKGFALPVPCDKHPSNNMGVNLTNSRYISLDWLTLTTDRQTNRYLFRRIEKYFRVQILDTGHSIKYYQKLYQAPFGISIATDRRSGKNSEGEPNIVPGAMVILPAGALSRLSPKQQRRLLLWFKKNGFKAKRLDIAFDDYTQTITPGLVRLAHVSGNVRGFRKLFAEVNATDFVDGPTFETYYLGTRGKNGSGLFLRCYDAGLNHPGNGDFTRLELEFSGDKANQVFDMLADLPLAHWAEYMMSVISGSVNFIDSTFSSRTDRCPRLPWWEDIVGNCGVIKISPYKTAVRQFDKVAVWFDKNIKSMFALISDAAFHRFGFNYEMLQSFWVEMWLSGKDKYKHRHRLLLAEAIA
jgi:hypothetical protein